MEELAFVVKVTDQCNLYCDYCYYYAGSASNLRTRKHKDLEQKLLAFADRLKESERVARANEVMVILHGGEPLLAPRDVIDKFLAETRKILGDRCRFSLQTNGVLLDEAWIDMLLDHDVSIGFSIDGPQKYHDIHRVDSRGRGTHAETVSRMRLLQRKVQERGFVRPNILAVYNPDVSADEYFNHFVLELDASGYDVLFPDDLERFEDRQGLIDAYRTFVSRTWQLWRQHDNPRLNIRFINRALKELVHNRNFLFDPDYQRVLVVDMKGDLFFEDNFRTLVDFEDLKVGSWIDSALDVSLAAADNVMKQLKSYAKECEGCRYLTSCKGGQYSTRLNTETNSYGLSYLCDTYKDGYAHAETLIAEAQRKKEARRMESLA